MIFDLELIRMAQFLAVEHARDAKRCGAAALEANRRFLDRAVLR